MNMRTAFQHDCFALTHAAHTIPAAVPNRHSVTNRQDDLQQILRQDGWLRTTAVSGGSLEDRRRIFHAAWVQARRRGLPFLLLSGADLMFGLPWFRYDPFPNNKPTHAAFLLAQTVRVRGGCSPDEIAFSLDALLRYWNGGTLDEFLSISSEDWETYAQEAGTIPFAQRDEFRRVFYMMEELRHLPVPSLTPASLSSVLRGGGAQIYLTSPLHWVMALKEAENLPVPVFLACEEIPFSELPDCLEPLLRCRTMIGAENLPGVLSEELWKMLISRVFVTVAFSHPSAYAAEKLAKHYGMHDELIVEHNQSTGRSWLSPWDKTISFGQVERIERRYQIPPERIQYLAPGQGILSCGGLRRICTFREGEEN